LQFTSVVLFKTLDTLQTEKGPISFIDMPISANGVDGWMFRNTTRKDFSSWAWYLSYVWYSALLSFRKLFVALYKSVLVWFFKLLTFDFTKKLSTPINFIKRKRNAEKSNIPLIKMGGGGLIFCSVSMSESISIRIDSVFLVSTF